MEKQYKRFVFRGVSKINSLLGVSKNQLNTVRTDYVSKLSLHRLNVRLQAMLIQVL
jgi:hypothetical protein